MYHRFNVVYEPLMLDLCCILHPLLYFYRVLVDLGPKLSRQFYLNMCLSDIILHNQEHSLEALKKNPVFMSIEIFR